MNLKVNKDEIDFRKLKEIQTQIDEILEVLIEYLCLHIKNQINAGADVVQIFDSWAGLLMEKDLSSLCYKPNSKIVKFCKENNIPSICFPRGIKENYKIFNEVVSSDGLNLDYKIDPLWAKNNLKNVVLQGGMSPFMLIQGKEKEMYSEAKKYLDIFKDVPYIFNLGHGLVPETDPANLGKLIKFVREH